MSLWLFADDRTNADGVPMEFKSKQWFGASVRSDGEHILDQEVMSLWLFADDRTNADGVPMEFKSKQWFGASVRSDGEHILWSTYGVSEREPVGTCYLKKGGTVVEYSPCRSGQLISDDVSEIFTRFDKNFITPYGNTHTTKSAGAQYDDSYLGNHDLLTVSGRWTSPCQCVNIFNGLNMESMENFTGTQMAAYFGHSVAAGDVNNDGITVTVALFFMSVSQFGGSVGWSSALHGQRLRWKTQGGGTDVAISAPYGGPDRHGLVYIHNGRPQGPNPTPSQVLQGKWASSYMPASFGYSMTGNTDIDQNGYPDVAISAPYGGPDRHGLVYIHNGRPQGPNPTPSQVLQGKWASSYMPASFGYSMTGNTDIDQNGYPDLIVGVFGADKAVLYRSSSPGQVLLPIANWKPKEPPVGVDDMGPQILHVYELLNSGPSTVSKASLEVLWPYEYKNSSLLYIMSYETDGPINCTTVIEINPLNLSTENQNRSYVVRATATFNVTEMPYKNLVSELPSNSTTVSVSVMWVVDTPQPVPGWVVALAVLAGLLLLALLIFIMYKVQILNLLIRPDLCGGSDVTLGRCGILNLLIRPEVCGGSDVTPGRCRILNLLIRPEVCGGSDVTPGRCRILNHLIRPEVCGGSDVTPGRCRILNFLI
ncbi:hypothetical protein F2P81_021740 [Scophthalmus maximus]|uniref:Integrin alpha third immunoglobulin-like domain-containing protein n=1 Tax=Scophthalmus maximus TaxID=52904 RepID=A0A6A4RY64_SCOMX|nr:hypothetical protein F2P81_021740 [Scophthalmus maximus]